MLKANYILVNQKEGEEDELLSLMEQTNPTFVPSRDEFVNLGNNRLRVTGVEWLLMREQVNIYIITVE